MEHHTLTGLVMIFVFGISAQWLAMRLKMPSILFLLVFGFIAGPVTHLVDPNAIFGDLLFPLISLSVAIILFEGGMDLKLNELKDIGAVVRNLITIGVLVAWVLITLASVFILNLNWPVSILLGAILVVTGPTVVGPLLRHVRPSGRVANVVKWEGIMNDPVGVVLAVLVFEAIISGDLSSAGVVAIEGIIKTAIIGVGIGGIGAFLLIFLLRRYWIPDSLHQVVTLMFIFMAFAASNHFQAESGLLTVTLMGIILVNQKKVSVHHILEFKENLRTLIISTLFIILAARLELSDFQYIDARSVIFIVFLIVVVRPLCVFISAKGSPLNWKEKVFVSLMAPRGIVAAAMTSIFVYELQKRGIAQVEYLVPTVFLVIVVTVAFYGLLAMPVARVLGLATKNPQGVLIVGAHAWAISIAQELKKLGFKTLLTDTNRTNVHLAEQEGLNVYYGNVFSDEIEDKLDLNGIGKMIAVTPNDEANSLSSIRMKHVLGQENVYQISPDEVEKGEEGQYASKHLHGRYLFQSDLDCGTFQKLLSSGAELKQIYLHTNEHVKHLKKDKQLMPLFLMTEQKELQIFSYDQSTPIEAGQLVLVLDKSSIK